MSDQSPYGRPPQDPQNPYGQQPAPPPAPPAQPPQAYQPGSYSERYAGSEHDPGYGAPAGYSPGPAYGSVGIRNPDKRPGTVTAAGVVTLVFSVLGLLGGIIGAIAVAASRDDIVKYVNDHRSDFEDALKQFSPDDIVNIFIGIAVVFALWCAIAALLGALVLRRSKVARVLLVISSVVTALLSLLGIASLFSAVTLIAAVAVVVMLFTGGASDWFARRSRVGYPQA